LCDEAEACFDPQTETLTMSNGAERVKWIDVSHNVPVSVREERRGNMMELLLI
jgi:hypothetical protein